MVEQIFDKKELESVLLKSGKEKNVMLYLSESEIEEWKQNRNFHFIKTELENLTNLKFACVKTEFGCFYYFIAPTETLSNRIASMLFSLYEKKQKQSLVKSKTHNWGTAGSHLDGEVQSCPLF